MREVELSALDGSNLLAFMAALGTLRVLTEAGRKQTPVAQVCMSWSDRSGKWAPTLHHSVLATPEKVADELGRLLCGEDRRVEPALLIAEDLTLSPDEFRSHALRAATDASTHDRVTADFLAAFGCEAREKRGQIDDTAMRTMSGAGHQHFLASMAKLCAVSTRDNLFDALFRSWRYEDDRPSMRWDPNDYRPYALRAFNPSGDPIRTVRGANRLAIEALPYFATVPTERGIATTAFSRLERERFISWPVWITALELASAGAVMAYPEIVKEHPDSRHLAARGIGQVFRARRFTEGQHRNFSPSRELL
jgi:hypothetical protein